MIIKNKMDALWSEALKTLPPQAFSNWLSYCFGILGKCATRQQVDLIEEHLKSFIEFYKTPQP